MRARRDAVTWVRQALPQSASETFSTIFTDRAMSLQQHGRPTVALFRVWQRAVVDSFLVPNLLVQRVKQSKALASLMFAVLRCFGRRSTRSGYCRSNFTDHVWEQDRSTSPHSFNGHDYAKHPWHDSRLQLLEEAEFVQRVSVMAPCSCSTF